MIAWLQDPWIWFGIGLVLLLAELMAPGYVLLSFSLGAFALALGLVGWSLGLGLVVPDPAGPQGLLVVLLAWMLFSGLAALLIWRLRPGRARGEEQEDVNDFRNRM